MAGSRGEAALSRHHLPDHFLWEKVSLARTGPWDQRLPTSPAGGGWLAALLERASQ